MWVVICLVDALLYSQTTNVMYYRAMWPVICLVDALLYSQTTNVM